MLGRLCPGPAAPRRHLQREALRQVVGRLEDGPSRGVLGAGENSVPFSRWPSALPKRFGPHLLQAAPIAGRGGGGRRPLVARVRSNELRKVAERSDSPSQRPRPERPNSFRPLNLFLQINSNLGRASHSDSSRGSTIGESSRLRSGKWLPSGCCGRGRAERPASDNWQRSSHFEASSRAGPRQAAR